MGLFEKVFGTHSEHELKRIEPIVQKVESLRASRMPAGTVNRRRVLWFGA